LTPRVSPDERGGSRSSRTRVEMRWTRKSRLTSVADADGEVVWSWRPGAGAKFRGSQAFADDGGNKAGHRGELEVSRKAIAQGKPDCLRWTCMLVCAPPCAHCTRDRGCSAHPAFPAPSSYREGQGPRKARASVCRENADAHPFRCLTCESRPLLVIARSPCDEAIHVSARGEMDCFAEPVIGRAFARPVGSQ